MRRRGLDARPFTRAAALLLLASLPFACNVISGVNDFTFEGTPCKLDGDCPSTDEECQEPACENGYCKIRMLDGEVAAKQDAGDCKRRVCRNGAIHLETDSSDEPVTATPCDDELCNGDEPSNPPLPEGMGCGPSSDKNKCDGDGNCVDCMADSDCPGLGEPCRFMVCEGDHHCRIQFKKTGTALTDEFVGDCMQPVCDGMGAVMQIPANSDLPNDSNECTEDACSNGEATYVPVPMGTPCGNNLLFCNAFGQCTGCTSDADCSANQVCDDEHVCQCKPTTCVAIGASCGVYGDGCGGFLDCNNGVKDGGESGIDCGKAPACTKCTLGVACATANDCQTGLCVDGVCCNEACDGPCQACTGQKKGYPEDGTCGYVLAGLDPDADCVSMAQDPSTCGYTGACNGSGECQRYGDGTACSDAVCDAGSGVYTPKGVCIDGSCDVGAPKNCQPYTCVAEGCASSCTKDGDCESKSYCSNSICKPKKKQGESCDSASACESGPCIDGYCCNSQCTETCKACNIAGSLGTCTFLPQGLPDVSNCLGNKTCDGYGVCKKAQAEPCAQNAECATGNCVDGVCCNSTCDAPCRSCNVEGSKGTCGFVADGDRDGALCKDPSACSGGTCKKGPGEICAIGAQCFSGYCVDGVCCTTECKEACKACNVPGSAGTCSNVPMGQTDPGLCPAPKHCNGQGVCLL